MLPPRRILLADDDLEVRAGVAELLAPLGLECLQADSGPEALRIARVEARSRDLHLMVLDLHMPGLSGLDVLRSLRVEIVEFDVPCIFYSGEATEAVRRRALDAGASAFLKKPVQPEELRGEVLRALERGRMR